MGLIDLQTDLKSLKYSTVPGNGTGPIIQKGIPLTQTSTIGYSADYAFQGQGFLPALEDDILRIGGWFNQNRGNWALKQTTLEAFNPKTESDLITRVPDVLGINAIASTGGSPLGIYLAKNGIAGFIPEDSKYEANVRENNNDGKNRLVELTNRFIYQNDSQTFSFLGPLSGFANNVSEFFNPDDSVLFSYVGGPGGPITTIRKASNQRNNGKNPFSTSFVKSDQSLGIQTLKTPNTTEEPFIPKNNFVDSYITSLGLGSYTFENIQNNNLGSILAKYTGSNDSNDSNNSKFSNPNANLNDFESTDDYSLGLDKVTNTYSGRDNSYITSLGLGSYTFENIQNNNLGSILAKYTGSNDSNDSNDSKFSNPNANLGNTIQTDSYELGLDDITNTYSEEDNSYLEGRETQLKPQRKNIFPKTFGLTKSQRKSTGKGNSDKVTLRPIFAKVEDSEANDYRDLIKFKFAAINNKNPNYLEFIQFRAYLTNFTDNFNPSWDSVKYVGRGEEFYNYTGFSRNVSFNLAFAALTRQELIPLYNKINYLASLTAPDYTDNGYIRGNIVKLTIGDYITNQPGVIDSLSYNIEDNVMWEINLDKDYLIGQYPHVLRAQVSMKLIHKELPQKGYSFIGSGDSITSLEVPSLISTTDQI